MVCKSKGSREEVDEAMKLPEHPDITRPKQKPQKPKEKERESMPGKDKRKRITRAMKSKIQDLRKQGHTVKSIAEEVGISTSSINRVLSESPKEDGTPQDAPPVAQPEPIFGGIAIQVPGERRLFLYRPGQTIPTLEFSLEPGTTLRLG